jgi:kumamolisin
MDLQSTVVLTNSLINIPNDVISTNLVDDNEQITATVFIRRQTHKDLNLSLKEYANKVKIGEHPVLNHDDFFNLFGSSDEDINLVKNFFSVYELIITECHHGSAFIKLSGTAKQFNSAFKTTLINVVTPTKTYISYEGYLNIPQGLNGIITSVIGLDDSITFEPRIVRLDPNAVQDNRVSLPLTPEQVAKAYQAPDFDGEGTCVGILELGGGWTTQNLTSTFSRIGLANPTVIDISVDGATNSPDPSTGASGEVMLDMYVVAGVVPKATLAMYWAPNTFQGFLDGFAAAIFDDVNKPCAVSVSWAAGESAFGYNTMLVYDEVLQAASVLGITITVSAGDAGAEASVGNPDLTINYPSSSPWVLACGGTSLYLNNDGTIADEYVWNQGNAGTGGGVSAYYPLPDYQQKSLTYKTFPDNIVHPLTMRGIPDVAGPADPWTGYQFYCGTDNAFVQSGGTSAVSPLWASIVARCSKQVKFGFIQPKIYAEPDKSFRDITVGNNAGPGPVGYSATTGWDACTGLGTPVVTELIKVLNSSHIDYPIYLYNRRPNLGKEYPRMAPMQEEYYVEPDPFYGELTVFPGNYVNDNGNVKLSGQIRYGKNSIWSISVYSNSGVLVNHASAEVQNHYNEIITTNFTAHYEDSPLTAYFSVTNINKTIGAITQIINVGAPGVYYYGQAEFTTPGTYTWTATEGINNVSVVCIGGGGGGSYGAGGGGGGLGWKNNIPVIAGQTYTVVVGSGGQGEQLSFGPNFIYPSAGGDSYFISEFTVAGFGGAIGENGYNQGYGGTGLGGNFVGDDGGQGGDAPNSGGGGAGGYLGKGGATSMTTSSGNPASGSGGGGGYGTTFYYYNTSAPLFGGGGGVGIYGIGADGVGGTVENHQYLATAGSGGYNGSLPSFSGFFTIGGQGGQFGGGGGTGYFYGSGSYPWSGNGSSGAVRIIWGPNRYFPGTNTTDW